MTPEFWLNQKLWCGDEAGERFESQSVPCVLPGRGGQTEPRDQHVEVA